MANKKKNLSSKGSFKKIHLSFKILLVVLGAIIILVFFFTHIQTKYSFNSIFLHPSPTISAKKSPQEQTITLAVEATLSSGWKKYTVPSQCYSFAFPPQFVPVITNWAQTGPFCDGRIVTVILDPSTSILISDFLGGTDMSPDQYMTEEHITVANNPYTITKLWIHGQTAPIEIWAEPSEEKSLYKLPAIELVSFDENKHAPKQTDNSTLSLFYQILSSITISTQTP